MAHKSSYACFKLVLALLFCQRSSAVTWFDFQSAAYPCGSTCQTTQNAGLVALYQATQASQALDTAIYSLCNFCSSHGYVCVHRALPGAPTPTGIQVPTTAAGLACCAAMSPHRLSWQHLSLFLLHAAVQELFLLLHCQEIIFKAVSQPLSSRTLHLWSIWT